jgi:hypothetical protein
MDPHVTRLTTPEECEQFAVNVGESDPGLALQAKRRGVELRASKHGAKSDLEREALEVIYAYEAVLTQERGKKVRATRTWQMISRHGIIGTVERAVDRPVDTTGYKSLAAMGMKDLTFEAVVVRHPHLFKMDVVARCKERLNRFHEA